eukprot:Gb_08497 [translate_table: standard]
MEPTNVEKEKVVKESSGPSSSILIGTRKAIGPVTNLTQSLLIEGLNEYLKEKGKREGSHAVSLESGMEMEMRALWADLIEDVYSIGWEDKLRLIKVEAQSEVLFSKKSGSAGIPSNSVNKDLGVAGLQSSFL